MHWINEAIRNRYLKPMILSYNYFPPLNTPPFPVLICFPLEIFSGWFILQVEMRECEDLVDTMWYIISPNGGI